MKGYKVILIICLLLFVTLGVISISIGVSNAYDNITYKEIEAKRLVKGTRKKTSKDIKRDNNIYTNYYSYTVNDRFYSYPIENYRSDAPMTKTIRYNPSDPNQTTKDVGAIYIVFGVLTILIITPICLKKCHDNKILNFIYKKLYLISKLSFMNILLLISIVAFIISLYNSVVYGLRIIIHHEDKLSILYINIPILIVSIILMIIFFKHIKNNEEKRLEKIRERKERKKNKKRK